MADSVDVAQERQEQARVAAIAKATGKPPRWIEIPPLHTGNQTDYTAPATGSAHEARQS